MRQVVETPTLKLLRAVHYEGRDVHVEGLDGLEWKIEVWRDDSKRRRTIIYRDMPRRIITPSMTYLIGKYREVRGEPAPHTFNEHIGVGFVLPDPDGTEYVYHPPLGHTGAIGVCMPPPTDPESMTSIDAFWNSGFRYNALGKRAYLEASERGDPESPWIGIRNAIIELGGGVWRARLDEFVEKAPLAIMGRNVTWNNGFYRG